MTKGCTYTVITLTVGNNSYAPVIYEFGLYLISSPDAPTIASVTPGNKQATVSFNAPVNDGGRTITSYTVTASPGNITRTGTSSPIAVTGLTNGISYTFTVTATNEIGTSHPSAASNPVTPMPDPAYTASAAVNDAAPIAGMDTTVTLTVYNSDGGIDATFDGTRNVTLSGYAQAPDGSYGGFNDPYHFPSFGHL
ncbi:fibronectin type III domain-containing protein [Thermicanus aegyptius]|uniref:fibronectin type III domain-containing protein n=1 Tax=Thermicanus aegyptius TaxID=94009 RepID=UPI00041586FE|nr:fibronectin type III domain-containing protein [Thermicanus aegyptius]